MKIHIKFPDGGTFDFEKEPMTDQRFYAICCVTGAVAFLIFLFQALAFVR